MSSYALQVSFEDIDYKFAEEPDKLLWVRREETIFAFAGKRWENLESRNILCIGHPKILIFQPIWDKRNFGGMDPVFLH